MKPIGSCCLYGTQHAVSEGCPTPRRIMHIYQPYTRANKRFLATNGLPTVYPLDVPYPTGCNGCSRLHTNLCLCLHGGYNGIEIAFKRDMSDTLRARISP